MANFHASCVTIDGKGVFLHGPSGSGKSDLALRLIDAGAVLVADDQVLIDVEKSTLFAHSPQRLQGMIEIYGVGLLKGLDYVDKAPLHLAVKLTPTGQGIERLPLLDRFTLDGASVLQLTLDAFHVSTPAKIRAVLKGELHPQDALL